MKLPLQNIRTKAATRPPGYFDDVVSRGVVDGEILDIPDSAYADLVAKYDPATLTITELTTNFLAAAARWTVAGFPFVSEAEFQQRLACCKACDQWRTGFFAGCKTCGCLRLKLEMPTERCPLGKWDQKAR